MKALDTQLVRRAGRSTESLLALLFEGLDWPIPAGMQPEDVPLIKWTPEELHLDPKSVAKLSKIQQLPPLKADQPFGVFILNFEGGQLPVGAVRRVVSTLVRKKRAQQRTKGGLWNLDDLIFFCQSKDGVASMHMVAFQDTGKVPVMKVVSWNEKSTDNSIQLIASSQLPELAWPEGSLSHDQWRARWRGAFQTTYRQTIKNAKVLAQKMAEVAKNVRDEVSDLYDIETARGPLRQLHDELSKSLRADMTPAEFADMYAQTMVYGLLTARITHPEDFYADALNSVLRFENPFLDALYEHFRRQGDEVFDADDFGLHDLAELLGAVDVDRLLADFGVDERKDDPVVFFYEEFLQEYDPKQRRELGTYYTPIPVVRFMVRAVDHIIKTEFDLPLGVADPTTWGEYSKSKGIPIPKGLKKSDPVIRMIDPATGTGTFLLEWYRQAKANLGRKPKDDDLAGVVSRMDALEISLSSYAVSHLKTSLELPPAIRERQQMGIRLADTLAPRVSERPLNLFGDDPIAEEGIRAEEVKFDRHHSVVLGNPPYLRVDKTAAGGWVAHSQSGRTLFSDITDVAKGLNVAHQSAMYNLYVYFWRWGLWKAFERSTNAPGVCAFITASSWLTGPGLVGLRELALRVGGTIRIVDLGGDGLLAETDENVFPIQTPVAIVIVSRPPGGSTTEVSYSRLKGTRGSKFAALEHETAAETSISTDYQTLRKCLVPATGASGWPSNPALADLIPWQQPGCKYGRTWPQAPDPSTLRQRWNAFIEIDDPDRRAKAFVTGSSGRNIYTKVSGLDRLVDATPGIQPLSITRYGFRSFDRQWCLSDPRLAKTESPSLWSSISKRQIFLVSLMSYPISSGPALTATEFVPDMHSFRGSFGGKDVFPIYRDRTGTPNSDPELLETIAGALNGINAPSDAVIHEDLVCYIFGILSGTDYSTRFATELETPGARVPITADRAMFDRAVELGRRLLNLQTFGARFAEPGSNLMISPSIRWKAVVTAMPQDPSEIVYSPSSNDLRIADGCLAGVSPAAWAFQVSGMPVIKKWLGYRTAKGTGRAASSDSPLDKIRPTEWLDEWSEELRELVHVLTETIALIPTGVALLDEIMAGPLISADELPEPPAHLRKPPKAGDSEDELDLG